MTHLFQSSALFQQSNHGNIDWNHQTEQRKARKLSKHLPALEQLSKIFKDTTDVEITRVTTPNAHRNPLHHAHPHTRILQKQHQKSISATLTAIIQLCPQNHQPYQVQCQMNPDNYHAYCAILSPKMKRTIPWLSILSNIKSGTIICHICMWHYHLSQLATHHWSKHYTNPVIHPETGESLTRYKKFAINPLTQWPWN